MLIEDFIFSLQEAFNMISYDSCPCCGQKSIVPVFSVEDYTVSHELFEIWECRSCTLRFTQNLPDATAIGTYYQSENYISHSDTSEGFINRLYHTVRNRTLRQKRKLVEKMTGKSAGKILDIGSGTGAFLSIMREAGWQITGLEPDATARQKAKELYQLEIESAENFFSLPEKTFDAITMWHVLEHVHPLHNYIAQAKKLLKPGGKLFIAVPNYTSDDETVYKQYWAAYDVPRHLYHFSPEAMQTLLELHGIKINSMKPMWYDSFYVSMLSEQYKNGKSNNLKAFMNGAISNLKAMGEVEKCSSVIYVASAQP